MAAQLRPIRILCLHGFGSSGDAFQGECDDLAAALGDDVVLEAAPHFGPWWFPSSDNGVTADPRGALGWEASARELEPLCGDGYDGVLGFSQGAAMAGVLCALRPAAFRFAVLACGYAAVGTGLPALAEAGAGGAIALPSLHLVGARDSSVPPEASAHFAARFRDPTVHAHAGGHWIPRAAGDVAAIRAFLVSNPRGHARH